MHKAAKAVKLVNNAKFRVPESTRWLSNKLQKGLAFNPDFGGPLPKLPDGTTIFEDLKVFQLVFESEGIWYVDPEVCKYLKSNPMSVRTPGRQKRNDKSHRKEVSVDQFFNI